MDWSTIKTTLTSWNWKNWCRPVSRNPGYRITESGLEKLQSMATDEAGDFRFVCRNIVQGLRPGFYYPSGDGLAGFFTVK